MPCGSATRTIEVMNREALPAPHRLRRARPGAWTQNARSRRRPADAPRARPRDDLEPLTAQWQRALDAGDRALRAAGHELPSSYLGTCRRELTAERRQTTEALIQLARRRGLRSVPWLSPVPMSNRLLGLDASVEACLFDLDGVLTDSGSLHATAWGTVLDDFLLRLSGPVGWQFIPFDPDRDYRAYIEGRSRSEGVHAFLASRGIRIPEGGGGDPPDADTASGLAKRKGDAVVRAVEREGVTARPGVRRYLEAAGRTGLKRAVVSASASTIPMLQVSGLAPLIDSWVDAAVIAEEGVRTPPFPDLLLAACRRLDVRPDVAVMFTHRPGGVAAGRAAGMRVIGVGEAPQDELLLGFGADLVVPSLSALLDPAVAEMPHGDARSFRTQPAP